MGFDGNDMLVICVSPGLGGRWDVSQKGFDQPIVSFSDKEDAYAYATELMRTTGNATALVEDDEGFSLLPASVDRNSGAEPRRAANADPR